jgi:hypothetical protein
LNLHKNIYKLGYAYSICILSSAWTTSEEFKGAIFGKECWIFNEDLTEIIGARLDKRDYFARMRN